MYRTRVKTLLITPALAIAVLGTTGPAFADELPPVETVETAPPAEDPGVLEPAPQAGDTAEPAPAGESATPEISDDGLPTIPGSKPSDLPDARACEPGWSWESTQKFKDYHAGVGLEMANTNRTSRTGRTEFVSETSAEVGIGFSAKYKVKASVLIAEIEAEYGVNLSVSVTTKIGNKYTTDTPPGYTTHGKYGVYRLKSNGYDQWINANCTRGVKHNKTVYSPHRVGWYIWETH
ncbi:hypothetical protein AB0M58_26695 [Streptomyces bobili]|uniref:hypothetical protein n=1 Tax=Streptomyces bobili TaxID=67280 RepID=UPI00341A70B8